MLRASRYCEQRLVNSSLAQVNARYCTVLLPNRISDILISAKAFIDQVPCAGSGVVRIDLLHFLAGCSYKATKPVVYLSMFYCIVVY